jgi:hypothetical protein
MVMLQSTFTEQRLLYDVSDPVHPRLVCSVANDSAHLVAGGLEWLKPISANETDVVVHSLSGANDSRIGTFPFRMQLGAYLPDLSVAAYTRPVPADNANLPAGGVAVYLYAHGQAGYLYTYPIPVTDCICRFGLPQPTLAISPDGQYLVAGWPIGKGGQPLLVYRVSERTLAAALDVSIVSAFWDRSGHRLFLGRGPGDPENSWTPEAGLVQMAGASGWSFIPGQSPDGGLVAYTAYAGQDLRTYLYDMKAASTRTLINKLRSQVLFVKDDWVWYLEEATCDPQVCGAPWGTQPTGKVMAMQLSSGAETNVSFVDGENPVLVEAGRADWTRFGPGEFWPPT